MTIDELIKRLEIAKSEYGGRTKIRIFSCGLEEVENAYFTNGSDPDDRDMNDTSITLVGNYNDQHITECLENLEFGDVEVEEVPKVKTKGLRDDYYQGCYYDLDTKTWTLGETMPLRKLLDCWWNSVNVDGNICYKNAYLEDAEYELDELKEEDLDKLVKVADEWDEDGDGYPTISAEFVEEEKKHFSISKKI